jgi:pyrroline-5-carboxylate reductase
MTISNAKILLIGAGKMGSALLSAWLRAGYKPSSITVLESDTAHLKSLSAEGVHRIASLSELTSAPDCILLAVKPQSMDVLLPLLAQKCGNKPLYISIAAGKTLLYFAKHLGNAAVVRTMPNIPAIIGKGISALIANVKVSNEQKQLATSLLAAAGETVWLEDESLMDAVTALSGSGPAYVFLFAEALVEAGMSQGLSRDTCEILALYTIHGSAELAFKSKDSLSQLRKNVTSPGGTTEAALSVLMKNDVLKSIINDAIAQAVKRSKELA